MPAGGGPAIREASRVLKNSRGSRWERREDRMREAASEATQDIADESAPKQTASRRPNPLGEKGFADGVAAIASHSRF